MNKGLKHGDDGALVGAKNRHDSLARVSERALNTTHLHGVSEHAREAEGDALGEFVTMLRDLEAVAKVYMDQLARKAVEHQI